MKQVFFISVILISISTLAGFKTYHCPLCNNCNGKGIILEEKPYGKVFPGMEDRPTKLVQQKCPVCQGSGTYCPPPPAPYCRCGTCSGSGKEELVCKNCETPTGTIRCRTCGGDGNACN